MSESGSSAPHLANATRCGDLVSWGAQPHSIAGASQSSGRLLYREDPAGVEVGLWVCTPGRWRVAIPRDELCYFLAGRAEYLSADGERVSILPEKLVLFPAGWRGECTVHETMRNTYMLAGADSELPTGSTPVPAVSLSQPLAQQGLIDWGPIPTMLEGDSRTSGKLLHKGPNGRSECGIWRCTPGRWDCHVTRDEYCHFVEGRSTYVHQSGDVIEIRPDTVAFFPRDWKGICTVHQTVTKVYMIR